MFTPESGRGRYTTSTAASLRWTPSQRQRSGRRGSETTVCRDHALYPPALVTDEDDEDQIQLFVEINLLSSSIRHPVLIIDDGSDIIVEKCYTNVF